MTALSRESRKRSRTDAEGRYYRLPSAECVPFLEDLLRRDATIAQVHLTYIGPGSAARMNATHPGRFSFPDQARDGLTGRVMTADARTEEDGIRF